eukprot:COSAG03_NODE_10476_length_648_cov_14.579235_1_plen_72_part_10
MRERRLVRVCAKSLRASLLSDGGDGVLELEHYGILARRTMTMLFTHTGKLGGGCGCRDTVSAALSLSRLCSL